MLRPLLIALLVSATLCTADRARAADRLDGDGIRGHLDASAHLLAQRRAPALPELTMRDCWDLSEGHGVLEESRGSDGLVRATYFQVVDVDAWRLWLALSDSDQHEQFMPYIAESAVLERGPGTKLVYQYMDLPPGVKDRNWVIRSWDNATLWDASSRKLWETWWTLEPGGPEDALAFLEMGFIEAVDTDQVTSAIYTPVNEGYWLLMDLPDGRVLIAYQAVSDFGGKVPTWLVNELGPSSLKKLVQVVAERGRRIEDTFPAGTTPPPAPDGNPVAQLR